MAARGDAEEFLRNRPLEINGEHDDVKALVRQFMMMSVMMRMKMRIANNDDENGVVGFLLLLVLFLLFL